ncbi:MAG: sulfatase-like hydrolase/transferase [Acidobacteriota bacterium]|jgi:arylsulfatase A-like enzyme/Flp pilus assembly protein TadD
MVSPFANSFRPRSFRPHLPIVLLALACLAASGGSAVAGSARWAQQPPRRNLLLITLDTLRADRIGAYGGTAVATPALDRLAAEGVRFDEATTTAPLTLPAHASILTGQNPYRHGVRDNANFRLASEALTLTELLAGAGWDTGGFIGSWVLNADTGIAQGFDEFTRFDADTVRTLTSPGYEAQRRGEQVLADALPWILSSSGPFFAWVHLFDPHLPYEPPPPYDTRYPDSPYDGEVAYTDEVVGNLMRSLTTAGLSGNTIVAVVADHGEGLGDHGEQRHSFFLYDEVTRVPMLLRGPGVPRGVVVEGQVSVVDLLPTLLGLLGVEDPRAAARDGVDLRPLIAEPRAPGHAAYSETIIPLVEFGWSELRALRDGGFKYIAAPRPELYDLRTDPAERDDLMADDGATASAAQIARADALALRLAEMVAGDDVDAIARGERAVTPQRLAQLRALGYLGGSGVATPSRDDPKDHVTLFESFQDGVRDAGLALQAGDWAAAGRAIDELEALLPEHHLVSYYRGRLLLLQGDPEAAIAPLERSRELSPAHASSYVDLAAAYRLAGHTEESRKLLLEAMGTFPNLIVFPLLLGSHYHQDGLLDEALDAYLTAQTIDWRNPALLRNLGQLYFLRGEYADSAATYRVLVEVLPRDVDARLRYGLALEGAGALVDAAGALDAALELAPDNAEVLFHRARVAAKAGNREAAIALLQRALQIAPDYEEAREALRALQR